MKKILITGAGTGTGFSYITHIKKHWLSHVEIHICDVNDPKLISSSLFSDFFYKIPYDHEPEYTNAIVNIINRNNIDLVIPLLNTEMLKLSIAHSQGQLNSNVTFLYPINIAAKISSDKEFASSIMSVSGIPTPQIWNDYSLLPDVFFKKPKNGFGSLNALVSCKKDVFEQVLDEDFVYQELLDGPEVTIDCFYDPNNNFISTTCRERLEVKSGVCTKARIFKDATLTDIALKIARMIKIKGGFCFQVMKSKEGGEWKVIDLNMRLGAGTAMSYAAGKDYFAATMALYLNENYMRFLTFDKIGIVTRQYTEFFVHE